MSSSSSDDWGYEQQDLQQQEQESKIPGYGSSLRSLQYQILGPSEIAYYQQRAVNIIIQRFGLNHRQAANLLRKQAWDIEKLTQQIIDGNINQFICLQGHVQNHQYGFFPCYICGSECPAWQMRSLQCGHSFCLDCYKLYLSEQVKNGISCIFSTCPMDNCTIMVAQELFKQLLDHKLYEKYKFFLKNSFVELNPSIKWCPGLDCKYAIKYPQNCKRDIVCRCGYIWCFQCSNQAHRPITCEDLAKWKSETQDSGISDTNWLLAYTKACPKCGLNIQKNQGCMHMTCKCKYEFCWLCLGPWSSHGSNTGGYYKCNKFSENQAQGKNREEQMERVNALNRMKRLEHYQSRFAEHLQSVRFAKNKKEKLKAISDQIRKKCREAASNDISFLEEASDLIVEARSAIAYSYPYGFFLNSYSKLVFFEFIQGAMEEQLDRLDEKTDLEDYHLIKGNRLARKFEEIRSDILELVRILRNHFEETMDAIENGLPMVEQTDETIDSILQHGYGDYDDEFSQIQALNNEWICPACTLINPNTRDTCEVCETARN